MVQVFINNLYGSVRECFPISCHRNNNSLTKYQKESNAFITFLYCSFQGGVLHLYCERWREIGSGLFGKQSGTAAIFLLPANVQKSCQTVAYW